MSLPYSVQTNDVPAYFEMKVSVPEFEAMVRRQFDTLYREGETISRVMAIAVHPFVTGQRSRSSHAAGVRSRAQGIPTGFSMGPMSQTRAGESGSWFGIAPNQAKAFATALAIRPRSG